MKKNKSFIVILVVILAIAGVLVSKYNKLVNLETEVDHQYSQVQVVVKRRADLIPNLVNVVKGYAKHESDTLEKVVQARSGIDNAKNAKELSEANNELNKAIQGLNVVVERYPDLKANTNFLDLQAQLEGSENRISVERQRYNDTVKEYNRQVRAFPMNLFAKLFGFEKKPYFEISEEDKNVPSVNF